MSSSVVVSVVSVVVVIVAESVVGVYVTSVRFSVV